MFNAKPIEHLNGYESRTCYLGEVQKIAGIDAYSSSQKCYVYVFRG